MSTVEPLLSTKLYLPQPRGDLVPRPRLIERFNSGLKGNVTLVSAPAGYGKTTVVSAWAQQVEQQVIWLSLDENDNDLARFLQYLVAAIQQVDRNIGLGVLDALDSPQPPQAEILITLLINGIVATGKQFILVLDDCHEITNLEVFESLEFLIDHQPREMHIVFCGRVDPLISLSRLRVGGQLSEFRSVDLRFTKLETTALLNDSMNLDLSIDEIVILEKRTEGWIAGLQLAGLSLQQRDEKHEFILSFSGVHQHLFDYLIDEVIALQPSEIRVFLCQTSILDRLNASLCDSTLGITNSKQILQKLIDANLFLIPLNEEQSWFRYHHLFRDFLELCLKEDRPEHITVLHQRASSWFEENGKDSEAFSHLISAEEYADAARLIERKAKGMLERSELAGLKKLVDVLPEKYVRQRPRLGIYHTWAMRLSGSPFDVVESKIQNLEIDLEDCISGTSKLPSNLYAHPEDEYRNLKAHILALHAFQGIYSEDLSGAIELAKSAKAYRPDEKFTLSSLDFAFGWAYRFSGDISSANQAFRDSSALSLESGNTYMAVSTLCRAAYGDVLRGQLRNGEQAFNESLKLAQSEDGRQFPVAGYANVYLSGIHYEWNDIEFAKRYAIEGIQLCERVGFILDQVVGFNYLSRVHLAEGDIESAQDACRSAKELSQKMKDYVYTRRWAEDCQVRTWVNLGDYVSLERWIQTGDPRIGDMPNFKRDIDHIILARAMVELASNQPSSSYLEDVLSLIYNLEILAENANWNGKLIEILALKSKALLIANREDQALLAIEKALSLAAPEGYLRTFVDEGKSMEFLLQRVARDKRQNDYLQRLLAGFKPDQPIDLDISSQTLVESLSRRELDVLSMLATDMTGPEIAKEMNIALSTLRFHTRNIYGKLAVNNRRSAVRKAKGSQLI
jgi:LuxR family maltose regulon positive regulatory protein